MAGAATWQPLGERLIGELPMQAAHEALRRAGLYPEGTCSRPDGVARLAAAFGFVVHEGPMDAGLMGMLLYEPPTLVVNRAMLGRHKDPLAREGRRVASTRRVVALELLAIHLVSARLAPLRTLPADWMRPPLRAWGRTLNWMAYEMHLPLAAIARTLAERGRCNEERAVLALCSRSEFPPEIVREKVRALRLGLGESPSAAALAGEDLDAYDTPAMARALVEGRWEVATARYIARRRSGGAAARRTRPAYARACATLMDEIGVAAGDPAPISPGNG